MKKEKTNRVSKFMLAAFLLAASSGGIAWGQSNLGGAGSVQNIFGAGESARLETGQVVFPRGGTWTNAEIQIFGHGLPGNVTGAGNIVIHSYNAGGRYHDYTNVWTGSWSGNGNGRCPGTPWPAWDGGGINWNGPNPVLDYNSDPCNGHIHRLVSGGTSDPYTSNQSGGTDDGISLVQTAGTVVENDGTWGSRGTPKTSGGGLVDYKRPTTIAISGKTTINQIAIGDLRWYYRTYDLQQTQETLIGCRTGANCNATGSPGYYTWSANASYHRHQHKSHGWSSVEHIGNTFLDAGVLILSGADVCINNNISDNTATAQSAFATTSTEGVLIWPDNGENFTLRVGGDFGKISMAHKTNPNNSDHNNPYFTNDQFTALPVQNTSGNMYLHAGGRTYEFLNLENLPKNYENIPTPSKETIASILGVKGNFSNENAFIHTGMAASGNRGVIEVGGTTTGKQKFKVYSGGTIKNYSTTACNGIPCGKVEFASNNTPAYVFDHANALNILNDGNCCTAAIIFADAAAVNAVTTGINAATAAGDLLVRAHGNVNLGADATFTPAQQNNISILSDDSYISTKKFEHTAGGGGDKGHLTLWARGNAVPDPNPNNYCGGNIHIEGNLTTSSTSAASTWQNLYAAVQKNSENLAKFADCNQGEEISACTQAALNTGVQTRIQSDHDRITVTGDFTHTGKDGGLFVQGAGNVGVGGKTTIDFTAGTGDVVIQSKGGIVNFLGAVTYKGNATTDLFIDGETGVNFTGGSIDYTQGTDPSAHISIQSNKGTINFTGAPFTFKSKSTGNTQLWAGKKIESLPVVQSLLFEYAAAGNNSSQHIDWYAGEEINVSSKLIFKHNDVSDHRGMIALRAFTNKENLWAGASDRPGVGVCPQRCPDGGNAPTQGNINLNNAVTVLYKGTENVWMAANHDININHNYTHVAGDGQTNQGFARFVAGHDITTGKGNETTTSFNYLHKGDVGNFDMKAGNDIITHNERSAECI